MKKFIRKNILIHLLNLKGSFTYFGTKVFFPSGSTTFLSGYEAGIYESEILSIINYLIMPHSYFFDIGANIGTISVPVLANSQSVNVISFEASPNTLPYLRKTHLNSTFNSRWKIVDKAVINKAGIVSFSLTAKKNGAFESIVDTKRVLSKAIIEVEATTVDIVWQQLNSPLVSVIKCDIEGADLLALEGASKCILHNKPQIIVEWNKHNIKAFSLTANDMFSFLRSINYEIYTLPSLIKVNNPEELNLQQVYCEMYLLKPVHNY